MTRATPGRPLRADARRNYERIVAAAETVFAAQGADGSLEEIARLAEVGSATLHRHFPSRRALLLAVFEDGITALCDQARSLGDADPGPALTTWLRALTVYSVTHRGLSLSLLPTGPATEGDDRCHVMLDEAGRSLLTRAQQAGAVRPDVAFTDLLTLVTAIALAAETTGDPAGAERLLTLALTGIHPR
ncbi:TetR/AcrR family transcriptional regulator [Actinoplanes sp. CA-252034]|uniref:TetR/AcrR family transcriptional regulator n=1 Tax=Actinoplanes sp. CA-252034 TaxID=3239906 RepID=UPI003D974BD9